MSEIENVTTDLEKLHKLRERLAKIGKKYEEQKEKLLGPIKNKLTLLDQKHADEVTEVLDRIAIVEEAIKSEVVEIGESVSTEDLIAVYVRPRVTWNNDKLEGFALIHPEIMNARTVAPKGTVQIRTRR